MIDTLDTAPTSSRPSQTEVGFENGEGCKATMEGASEGIGTFDMAPTSSGQGRMEDGSREREGGEESSELERHEGTQGLALRFLPLPLGVVASLAKCFSTY